MVSGKWYIKYHHAEQSEAYVIYLTTAEHKAVRKFLNEAEYIDGGGWCGVCRISARGYKTREEAIAHIRL